jgi:flagellar L-ring protein precursor FlgH
MLKITFICLSLFIINIFPQDMRHNSFQSLFSDQKANKEGDAVTILVIESSLAQNQSQTSAGKQSDLGFDLNGSFDASPVPKVDVNIGSNNEFKGSGSTKTSGAIRTKISATIDSVLANGNLVIRGSKKIAINGEEQLVNIRGIVRTADIMADNSVLSFNISEAEISFEGSGMIDDAQKPGWLTKFFHWIF